MFGTYTPPFSLEIGKVRCSMTADGPAWRYLREDGDTRQEAVFGKSPICRLHPIEPLQLPKPLAKALVIQFDQSLNLAPREELDLFLTFPTEIGVFLEVGETPLLHDVFSLVRPKLSYYGNLIGGTLCRYHDGKVSFQTPEPDPLECGILSLRARNATDKWAKISKVLLPGGGMRLLFNEKHVVMSARMRVTGADMGEVECLDGDDSGMTVSLQANGGKRGTASRKSVMDGGV